MGRPRNWSKHCACRNGVTLADVQAKTLVETLADRLQVEGVEVTLVGYKLGDVEDEAMFQLLADTLKVVKSETLRDKLCVVETEAQGFVLANTLADVKA